MFCLDKNNKAFTLIELMVAVSVIALFSSVMISSMSSSRTKAKIVRAQTEMNRISLAMELFRQNNGELPPIGDNCSACTNPCASTWAAVIDPLVSGGYLPGRIDKDPWGNYYCYDDNYRVPACNYDTPLWSTGPNGARDTSWGNGPPTTFAGDDFGIIIEAPQC